jgi:hypothetical protein
MDTGNPDMAAWESSSLSWRQLETVSMSAIRYGRRAKILFRRPFFREVLRRRRYIL